MAVRRFIIAVISLVVIALAGCSSSPVRPSEDVRGYLEQLRQQGAEELLALEFQSVEETVENAERLLAENNKSEAERYFKLARLKARFLERNLAEEKARRNEQWLPKDNAEEEHLKEEAQRKEKEVAKLQQAEKVRREAERQLTQFHTVKRGETLPQIAALPEVYNDATLWPLLYRANRDQIRDPNYIWPGQVLLIGRNSSKDEIAEARRYAQERQLH